MLTVIVIAKECVPGRVKTRLTPEFSFEQAAAVASASLSDTLEVMQSLPATRRILAFDGDPRNAPAQAGSFEIVPQASGGLDARLAAVFSKCSGPTLLVGMDTPQLTADLLAPVLDWAADARRSPAAHGLDPLDAFIGLATDGGFWALAMAHPDGRLIEGVPMSRDDTGSIQLSRLRQAGLAVGLLAELTDVDTAEDAAAVAALAPSGRFAAAVGLATADRLAARQPQLAGARA